MSISIHWRPTGQKTKYFSGGRSAVFAVLDTVFPGRTIPADAGSKLRAMAAATNDEIYNEIADVIEQVGEIEFWSES